jgi:hypothetical protein
MLSARDPSVVCPGGGFPSAASVRFTNLVAMVSTLIACQGVETSWASPVTPFLIEKSLKFPQLGGVVTKLFDGMRVGLSESGHNTYVRCGCCCHI